jgi:tetratricopeptide (TPR) repeat protein
VHAAALYYGRPPQETPRKDLHVLYVFADYDLRGESPELNDLWKRVVAARAPWTLAFGSDQPHGFDAFEDTDESRRLLQQTIAFWKTRLESIPPHPPSPPARALVAAIYANKPERAAPMLAEYVKSNPNDALGHSSYGRMLSQLRRFDEAAAAFERVIALGAGDSMLFGQLALAQLFIGKNEEAVRNYERAFEAGIPPGPNTRGLAYFNLACGYARLGRNDRAFQALKDSAREGFANRERIEGDDDLKPLAKDPKYAELLASLSRGG